MSYPRYVLLTVIVTAILVAMTVQAAAVSGFAQFALPDTRILGFLNTTSALSLGAGAITLIAYLRNKKALAFTDEVMGEIARVTWPSRDETVRASTTVVLTTLFTAALLAFYDLIWKNLADLILFTEG